MSNGHDRDAARSLQSESAHFPQTVLQAALSVGGSVLPEEGTFCPKLWAFLLQCEPATIRRWVTKYDIPHLLPGDEMLIDAVDLRASVPKLRPSERKPKRGGNRRRKE